MKLALQTFTIRKSQKKDIYNTLKRCKDMGYDKFELSRFDFDEKSLKEFKRAKDDFNLTYLNFQKTLECISGNFDMVVKFCEVLECKVVCISVLPLQYILKKEKDIHEYCVRANELFDKFKEKGILLTYHTHDFEYINVGNYRAIDTIAKEIKTPLVVDCYWATRAGMHVESLLEDLKGHVHAIHLKDYNCTLNVVNRDCKPVALGLGTLNIKSIIDKANDLGLVYCAIEHHSNKPFEELEISMNYLKENNLLKVFE